MSSAKAGKRPLRALTPLEKLTAIRRVSLGGESKASVARDIGVPESTLRGWCKNQEKISYQVRTSPPVSGEDVPENIAIIPNPKRLKMEPAEQQPYNLSMKTGDVSNASFSSQQSDTGCEGEYPKSVQLPGEPSASPLNLRKTLESPPSSDKSGSCASDKARPYDKEKEKNKVELQKLSEELGLNGPEEINVKTVLNQWKNVMTFCQQQQQLQTVPAAKTTPPAKSSPPSISQSRHSPTSNGYSATSVDKHSKMYNLESSPSVFDNVSCWLRQHSYLNGNPQASFLSMAAPSTSSKTSGTNTVTAAAGGDVAASLLASEQMRLQWGLYQQNAYHVAQLQAAAAAAAVAVASNSEQPAPQQILYQQLTKESNGCEREVNSENVNTKEDNKPKNGLKPRSVLDTLLLNNNKVCASSKEDMESLDAQEALDHGEKFLRWLEHCSDPAVTSLQLHTVQSLIKNLKSGSDRRSGDHNRNKTRRK